MGGKRTGQTKTGVGDDFTLIKGLTSPVITRLQAEGILTFAQLAKVAPPDIVELVGDSANLTTEIIIKEQWIEQARKLAEAASVAVAPAKIIPSEVQPQENRITADFGLELLLDKKNKVIQTNIKHIQSQKKRSWEGWQNETLNQFLSEVAGVALPAPKPTPGILHIKGDETEPKPEILTQSLVAAEEKVPSAATANHPQTVVLLYGEVKLSNHFLPKNQGFVLNLLLENKHEATLKYHAVVYVKQIVGETSKAGETRGIINGLGKPEIQVQCKALKPGIYRLEVLVSATSASAKGETIPGYRAILEGGLLEVS